MAEPTTPTPTPDAAPLNKFEFTEAELTALQESFAKISNVRDREIVSMYAYEFADALKSDKRFSMKLDSVKITASFEKLGISTEKNTPMGRLANAMSDEYEKTYAKIAGSHPFAVFQAAVDQLKTKSDEYFKANEADVKAESVLEPVSAHMKDLSAAITAGKEKEALDLVESGNVNVDAPINGKSFIEMVASSDALRNSEKLKTALDHASKGQALMTAIDNDNKDDIARLSKEAAQPGGFDINGTYFENAIEGAVIGSSFTPMINAVYENNTAAIDTLAKEGKADINAADKSGEFTPLTEAAFNSDVKPETLDHLLKMDGIKVDEPDSHGNTALILAAELGYSDKVKSLLDAGADPTLKNSDGKTASDLTQAAADDIGANEKYKDKKDNFLAIKKQLDDKVAEIVAKRDAEKAKETPAPLPPAPAPAPAEVPEGQKQAEEAQILAIAIQAGNKKDALDLIQSGNLDVTAQVNGQSFENIVDGSDKVQLGDDDEIKTALANASKGQELVKAIQDGKSEDIERLSKEAAQPGGFSIDGTYYSEMDGKGYPMTPMEQAVYENNTAAMDTLAKEGKADVDAVEKSGDGNAIIQAAENHVEPETLNHLLAMGVKKVDQADTKGNTALMLTAQHGNGAKIASLLTAGADPTLTNTEGKTASDLAQKAADDLGADDKNKVAKQNLLAVKEQLDKKAGEITAQRDAEKAKQTPAPAPAPAPVQSDVDKAAAADDVVAKQTAKLKTPADKPLAFKPAEPFKAEAPKPTFNPDVAPAAPAEEGKKAAPAPAPGGELKIKVEDNTPPAPTPPAPAPAPVAITVDKEAFAKEYQAIADDATNPYKAGDFKRNFSSLSSLLNNKDSKHEDIDQRIDGIKAGLDKDSAIAKQLDSVKASVDAETGKLDPEKYKAFVESGKLAISKHDEKDLEAAKTAFPDFYSSLSAENKADLKGKVETLHTYMNDAPSVENQGNINKAFQDIENSDYIKNGGDKAQAFRKVFQQDSFSKDFVDAINTKATELDKAKVEEKPKDKVEEKPKDKVEEKPKDKVEEKPKDKVEEKPKDKVEEKPKDKVEEKPKDKVEEKPKDKVEEKPKDKVEEKPKDKVEEKSKTATKSKASKSSSEKHHDHDGHSIGVNSHGKRTEALRSTMKKLHLETAEKGSAFTQHEIDAVKKSHPGAVAKQDDGNERVNPATLKKAAALEAKVAHDPKTGHPVVKRAEEVPHHLTKKQQQKVGDLLRSIDGIHTLPGWNKADGIVTPDEIAHAVKRDHANGNAGHIVKQLRDAGIIPGVTYDASKPSTSPTTLHSDHKHKEKHDPSKDQVAK